VYAVLNKVELFKYIPVEIAAHPGAISLTTKKAKTLIKQPSKKTHSWVIKRVVGAPINRTKPSWASNR
ncbi:MAG: hypothetical protein MUQ50_05890, partial [Paracoccaceae bacterium]|nr:hypothetical protein [Paracoccaceae bacterium]